MTKARAPRFEYYYSSNETEGGWYWRFRARNGKITAIGGEAYSSAANVRRAITRHANALHGVDRVEVRMIRSR